MFSRTIHERLEKKEQQVVGLKAQIQRLKTLNDNLRTNMMDKDQVYGRQEEDNKIKGHVDALFRDIKASVNKWCRNSGDRNPPLVGEIDQDLFKLCGQVLPCLNHFDELQSYLESVDPKKSWRMFYRGLLAAIVTNRTFRSVTLEKTSGHDFSLNKADHEAAIGFLELELMKLGNLANLNNWRALTLSLFEARGRDPPLWSRDAVHQMANYALGILCRWLSPSDPREMMDDLVRIFKHAVLASTLMRTQRASWTLWFPEHVQMDPYTMREADQEEEEEEAEERREQDGGVEAHGMASKPERSVRIVATPVLFKRGNADGELFDLPPAVMKKAEVKCVDAVPRRRRRTSSESRSIQRDSPRSSKGKSGLSRSMTESKSGDSRKPGFSFFGRKQ
ncbi:hypothetical protein MCOR28_004958 [Pyricularia oryzae]|uniref:Uncharacterized protein n=1 Tax=Pyricularia grisea TaxID=148305 RepID=A0ABQ8NCA9_PYRGI|nr:hypothetical protein MCOR33_008207 [Pyricularia grisea]KAI6343073.1 hypothetical protein MCOR28_004958 [Pyricularia oryzae]KAI6389852.1 hypothetical protein MCOR24_010486 [Pyricularia oryzae]